MKKYLIPTTLLLVSSLLAIAGVDYNFTRGKLPCGAWDINNPTRMTTLAQDIEASSLSNKVFQVFLDGSNCTVTFSQALSVAESNTLTNVVAVHQVCYNAIACWTCCKTNTTIQGQQTILLLETRFVSVLSNAVVALKAEGILVSTNTYNAQNMTREDITTCLIQMTNQTSAADYFGQLETLLESIERITIEHCGKPPDGSTILYNIHQH